jgi:hypothetical protein
MSIPINDPPPTLADVNRSIWYSQLDRQRAAVVIERPTGSFTPRASYFDGSVSEARQGPPRATFRDAAVDALRIAGEQGAFVEPRRWPRYFRG